MSSNLAPATERGSTPIAVIDRRDGEHIRVAWAKYNDVPFLDVRLYFRAPDGEFKPTRKGCTFRPDQLDELATAIARAKATTPVSAR